MKWIVFYSFLLSLGCSFSQGNLYGIVKNELNESLPFAGVHISYSQSNEVHHLFADEFGRFGLENLPLGLYEIKTTCIYHETQVQVISIKSGNNNMVMTLTDTSEILDAVNIYYDSHFATRKMGTVEGMYLTNGIKTHHIDPKRIDANKAIDNARELYAKVPGLNIWESDAGGLQLGIGARGLSPSRTAHFNTRQNGYDISADALGYPETYYTPPSEALASIQLIRGAASLQFGPQFGGMINFKIKEPSANPFNYEGTHTYGAYNLFNTFNLVSGTIKKRFSYLAYFQNKRGDGWRTNSGFNQQNAFAQLKYHITERMFISVEQTHMRYLAQQAGGLTDGMFNQDPRQSIRDRNWFAVNWNITAAHYSWEINRRTTIDIKGFKVNAQRDALGNLEKISRADDGQERQLIHGDFNNIGGELRLLKRYPIGKKMMGITAAGVRYYKGNTISQQGLASANSDADFTFLNPNSLEGSDYTFPSQNIAGFFENILRLNKKISISAGVRFEHINTAAAGSYREQIFHPLTNELIFDNTYTEDKSNIRNIFLGGIGFSYRPQKKTEVYGNIAQNYRGINFSDIRIVNPNQMVDPTIQDERGFNADLGIRGERKKGIFDASAFFMYYDNKIGVISQKLDDYEFVRLRTNIGRAYSTGVELFAEYNFTKTDTSSSFFTAFGNFSAVYSKYGKYEESVLSQNWVELVPPLSGKIGLKYTHGKWAESLLGTYVHKHFSDGTNAVSDPNAIAGIIPSYCVLDLNGTYTANEFIRIKAGVNNLTNNKYFTRRATAYPGPGIIPSDGISFYVSLGLNF